MVEVNVPCGSCRLCCQLLNVPLAPGEERRYRAERWVHEGVDRGFVLERKNNGECIYLGANGCRIHGSAPSLCKKFDCRELARMSRPVRRKAMRDGDMHEAIFNRGRELNERLA